jgi:hypothetical protein
MKWEVSGKRYPIDFFGSFEPDEVLYDFDGPRIFTIKSRHDDTLLVYQCDEDEAASRFIVVPCDARLLDAVQAGHCSVRDALTQAWTWVVDQPHGQAPQSAWRVDLESIPHGVLPGGSVMLLPSMDPLLSVRMVGSGLGPGETPASVIRRVVEGASNALKTLVEFVLEVQSAGGRPAERLRRLYDLRAQRVAFASFEIAFKAPPAPRQESSSSAEEERKTLEDVGVLLQRALQWAEALEAPPNSSEEILAASAVAILGGSPEGTPKEVLAMLEALEKLTPPQHGLVLEVHIGGRLVGNRRSHRVLTRTSSAWVRKELDQRRRDRGPLVALTGLVREFDKDKLTFTLREIEGQPDQRCAITEALFDEAMAAFSTDEPVTVAGREAKARGLIDVVAMDRRAGSRASPRS